MWRNSSTLGKSNLGQAANEGNVLCPANHIQFSKTLLEAMPTVSRALAVHWGKGIKLVLCFHTVHDTIGGLSPQRVYHVCCGRGSGPWRLPGGGGLWGGWLAEMNRRGAQGVREEHPFSGSTLIRWHSNSRFHSELTTSQGREREGRVETNYAT